MALHLKDRQIEQLNNLLTLDIDHVEIQLMNIPTQTFVFPPEESDYLDEAIPRSQFRTETIQSPSEEHSYRFYYVPGFGAFDESMACRLHIEAVTVSGGRRW